MDASGINTSFSFLWRNSKKEKDDRASLFHVVSSQMKEDVVIQQLLVVARLPLDGGGRTELGDYYGKLIFKLRTRLPLEKITGLLLIYPTCLLHVVEGSREALNSVLKDMARQPESALLDAKIVLVGHGLQSRLFKDWNYKVLEADQAASKAAVEGDEEQNTETLVCRVLSALQELKTHLAAGSFPGPVLDERTELIVSQNVLEKLLSQDDFMSPQQHLEIYSSPLNISGELGKVDPRSLFPDI
ncbi:testis-expressed protein 47-like [Melanotaenia boesemani]|uniref:testis-expressed protein 47-like n=1 Tax=Melanotaenia boesemani TaxID=1250792 RepID=UPI001C05DF79|nr:testis-expressed protein 47-like [Melanotaenia boesemani]